MRWKQNPDVIVQRLGETLVLVNITTDRILELNDTAATLFDLAGSELTEEEMAMRLAAEYEVEAAALCLEIGSALEKLAAERVVEAHGA